MNEQKLKSDKDFWMIIAVVSLFVILLLVAHIIISGLSVRKTIYDNYIIPKQFAGVHYGLTDNVAIVMIDLNDPDQVKLLNPIEIYYRDLKLKGGE